jgi:6-phosphogluconolactonase
MTVIHVNPSPTKLCERLAERFVELSHHFISLRGSFHAALSGGRTPQTLFSLLASPDYKTKIDWQRIHLYMVDERFVPRNHPDSNAAALINCLTMHVPIPKTQLHLIPTEQVTHQQAAELYAETLKDHLPKNESHPWFDFLLLGTAEDGHVASLFPQTVSLAISDNYTTSVYVPKLDSWRITLTLPMLHRSTHTAFIVTGENKAPVVQRVFADIQPYLPIQLLNWQKAEWYLDKNPLGQ